MKERNYGIDLARIVAIDSKFWRGGLNGYQRLVTQ